jgi:glucose/arabinose dehydrogenase
MSSRINFALGAALLPLLGGCGGDGDGNATPDSEPPGSSPPPQITLSVTRAFPELTFSSPLAMLQAPGDAARWFVVEQGGMVRMFANDDDAATSETFIDIAGRLTSGGEKGLLGMAFHPEFPDDPRAYLSYTADTGRLVSRISEFRTNDDGATLDPSTERVLLTVNQPQSNHNGGGIAFGPDGFLYIGFGDGGGAGDQHGAIGNGQNLRTLLGKMLRIDVNDTAAGFNYAIPADNPFAGNALCGSGGTGAQECPEIFAYGFRNPWRWSFDLSSGDLWVGDVGQSDWEEIDNVVSGGNYGWRCREGAHAFNADCGPAQDLLEPVAEYGHSAGVSVTGGYVYRGSAIADLAGRYVFGDLSGRIWHIARDTSPTLRIAASDGFDTGLQISSFAQGEDAELYVVDLGGTLHRITAE